MAINIGEIQARLSAQTSGFQRGINMSSSAVAKLERAAKQVRAPLADMQKRLNKVATAAKSIALPTAAAFGGLLLGMRSTINAASDMVESNNVLEQSYGNLSDGAKQWVDDTASALSRSRQQMREYGGTMQAMLRPMIGNNEAAAEMSKKMSELAVHMGSFWNVADDDALTALRAGLVGETEPLRRFGVVLTEATLEQYRLTQGIQKSVTAMSQAEKVQLRYQYIMDRSNLVWGDAIRTAGGYQNRTKALQGAVQDLREELGTYLLPAATKVTEITTKAIRGFASLDDNTKRLIFTIGGIATGVVGAVAALGLLISAFGVVAQVGALLGAVLALVFSPAAIGIVAVIAAVGLFRKAWEEDWGGIQEKTETVVAAISNSWEFLKTWWDESTLGQTVRDAWQDLVDTWTDNELTLPQKVLKSVSIVVDAIVDLIPGLRDIWETWTDDDLSLRQKALKTVSIVASGVAGLIDSIMDWWTGYALELVERGAELLGLNPDKLWIIGFLEGLNTIWKDEKLTFGEKIVESIKLLPGGEALVEFFSDLKTIWTDKDLTFGQKTVATISLVVGEVTELLESIGSWWTGTALKLVQRTAKVLGLNPDDLWVAQFLSDLNTIWGNEELTFGQKTVESIKLLPGGEALVGFLSNLKDIWTNEDLTLPQKVLASISLTTSAVANLIDSIMDWWTGYALELVERGAELLGLNPDKLWVTQFLFDLNTIWASEDLAFGQKIVESIKLLPGGEALVGFVSDIKGIWEKEELTLVEKTVKTVSLVAGRVTGLLESIAAWWTGAALELVERTATLLGLNPDDLWIQGFLKSLNAIWKSEDLTFGAKTIETVKLIPGGAALVGFVNSIRGIWTNEELTLGQKVVSSVKLMAEDATLSITLATLAAVATWAIAPGVLTKLGTAITAGIAALASAGLTLGRVAIASLAGFTLAAGASTALYGIGPVITQAISGLAAGGLFLGEVAIAGLVLALTAGAIGWVFGDKEGRDGFIEAVKESFASMSLAEPITIPLAVMDMFRLTLDFGTNGLRGAQEYIAALQEQLEQWSPGSAEVPEGLKDLLEGFVELGRSLAEFTHEGFWLVFDIVGLVLTALDKAITGVASAALDFGKQLGQGIADGISSTVEWLLPDFVKNWFNIGGSDPEQPYQIGQGATSSQVYTPDLDRLSGAVQLQEAAKAAGDLQKLNTPTSYQLTDLERQMLAALAQLEAGTDGVEGMAAVVEVVFNRMKANAQFYGGTVEEVLRKQGQFEPVMTGSFDRLMDSGSIAASAVDAVDLALRRLAEGQGITGGATYFANLDIVQQRYGSSHWMLDPAKMRPTTTIGGHTFGLPGWAKGGYTADVGESTVAGVVHGGEWVMPAWMVQRYPGLTRTLENARLRGFQDGGGVGLSIPGMPAEMADSASWLDGVQDVVKQIGQTLLSGIKNIVDFLAKVINSLGTALLGEEKWSQFKDDIEAARKAVSDFVENMITAKEDASGSARRDDTSSARGMAAYGQRLNGLAYQTAPWAVLIAKVGTWWRGMLKGAEAQWGSVVDKAKAEWKALTDWMHKPWQNKTADMVLGIGKSISGLLDSAGVQGGRMLTSFLGLQTRTRVNNETGQQETYTVGILSQLGEKASSLALSMAAMVNPLNMFSGILDALNPTARFVQQVMSQLEPVISALFEPALMVADVLGEALKPILQSLFPVFKGVAMATALVAAGFFALRAAAYKIAQGIVDLAYQIFLWLPGFKGTEQALLSLSTSLGKSADESWQSAGDMMKAFDEVSRMTYEEAEAKAKLRDTTKQVTEALINVPQALNLNLMRWRSAVVGSIGIESAATGGYIERGGLLNVHQGELVTPAHVVRQGSSEGGKGDLVVNVFVRNAYGTDDLDKQIEAAATRGIKKAMRKAGAATTGTVFSPA